MRAGEFENGRMTLRAKIDLASGNFNMRDPVIYRINHTSHHRTGDKWCIYPMYDYAHPFEDAMECITHSLCSLEFEDHRPFYDWVVQNVTLPSQAPADRVCPAGHQQHGDEQAEAPRAWWRRTYVDGWDDPRMPTICGLRRRGYTPASIRNFSERNGVSKVNSTVEYAFLEYCLREDLNLNARRVMAVLDPVKLTIDELPRGPERDLLRGKQPQQARGRGRGRSPSPAPCISSGRTSWRTPVPKFKRLYPGGPECRLKGAYLIRCTGCVKDENGKVVEILAELRPGELWAATRRTAGR